MFSSEQQQANLPTMPPQIVFIKLSKSQSIPVKIFINKSNVLNSTSAKSLAINAKSLITLQSLPINYFQVKLSNNYSNTLIESHIKPVFLKVLFEFNLEHVCSIGHTSSGKVTINSILRFYSNSPVFTNPLESSNDSRSTPKKVRFKFSVPVLLIVSLRIHFNKLSRADVTYLNSINALSNTTSSFKLIKPENQFSLLIKKQSFKGSAKKSDPSSEPIILMEEDEDDLGLSLGLGSADDIEPSNQQQDTREPNEDGEGDEDDIYVPDDKKSLAYKYKRIQIFNSIANSIKLYIVDT